MFPGKEEGAYFYEGQNLRNVYLNAGFWEVDLEGDFFSHENVWVTRFSKEGFENV